MLKEITLQEAVKRYQDHEQVRVWHDDGEKVEVFNIAEVFNGCRFIVDEEECHPAEGAIGLYRDEPPSKVPKKNSLEVKPARKKIDEGKVKALREAGWSQAKIADEMGVSQGTISSLLKKLQNDE